MDARVAAGDKRPRSPSGDFTPTSAAKVPKTQLSQHLHINYLARQYPENLPLVSTEDNLPNILRLLGEYDGVLQRHESIAGNLGACTLGPILMKRFERMFDAPPRVLKSNGKEGTTVTWLDVIEFARTKPDQFTLDKRLNNGARVCQFTTKQCRVEISEEDYVLIASGMPQKLIPPQPIEEDEEKEIGSLEILEKNLQQITSMADSAAARARQLIYRLSSRRIAILTRRESDRNKSSQGSPLRDHASPDSGVNGHTASANPPHSPPGGGFTAINSGRAPEAHDESHSDHSSHLLHTHPNPEKVTVINGTNISGVSLATRAELVNKFFTSADQTGRASSDSEPATSSASGKRVRGSDASEFGAAASHGHAVAIPNTPSSLLPQPKSTGHHERDDGGPFKMQMVARMDALPRGQPIYPPCDRCRRLQIECLKNLTACWGCTKKHAKCSWREVKEEELQDSSNNSNSNSNNNSTTATTTANPAASHNSQAQTPAREGETSSGPSRSLSMSRTEAETNHAARPNSASGRAGSTSSAPVQSEARRQPSSVDLPAMRRTNSEIHSVMLNDQPEYDHRNHRMHQRSSHVGNNNNKNNANKNNVSNSISNRKDDDRGATSRLLEAIMDTVDRAHGEKTSGGTA